MGTDDDQKLENDWKYTLVSQVRYQKRLIGTVFSARLSGSVTDTS